MIASINGRKTYTLCLLAICVASIGLFTGHMDAERSFKLIFEALTFASIRHAVAKEK